MDVRRAYFCAAPDPNNPAYVELPLEDEDHGVTVGLLKKHMYGTRRAADGWRCEYAGRLVNDLGFTVGDASACVFFHKSKDLRCSVHGSIESNVGRLIFARSDTCAVLNFLLNRASFMFSPNSFNSFLCFGNKTGFSRPIMQNSIYKYTHFCKKYLSLPLKYS